MVSNKTKKLIISKSKRPPSNEIEVIDEYGDKRCFPITGEMPLTIYVDKKVSFSKTIINIKKIFC